MKPNITNNFFKIFKLNYLGLTFLKLSVIVILVALTEIIQAQGSKFILKVSDPDPVCSPATIDLTSDVITAGSTPGISFVYYTDSDLTIPVSNPKKVTAGVYYFKGKITNPCTAIMSFSVKVTVLAKPKLIIPNPVVQSTYGIVDLTLQQITSGSDEGLSFTYWYDAEAKQQLPSPGSTREGQYFIKGTSRDGCFDIQPITIKN